MDMYEIGQLVWLYKSDMSDLMDHPPVLILKRYWDVPKVFQYNDDMNHKFTHGEPRLVYDIMCGGVVEVAVAADWFSDTAAVAAKKF